MFRSAVIKLTLWYLLIIMLISASFSIALYSVTSHELEQNFMHQSQQFLPFGFDINQFQQAREQALNELEQHEILNLIRFNLIVLILAGAASYFLARRTLDPLERAMEAQSRFTGDASHELRTPLTVMRSEIEVALRESKLSTVESRELLESNLEEVVKLEALSQALLQLARFSSDTGQFEMTDLDIAEPIKSAVDRVEKRATERGINIDVVLKHFTIRANEASLSELFVTLIDNAIKYGKPSGHVGITMKSGGGEATITIKDDGIGINSNDLPHIFDRFYRADTSRSKQKSDGYGLGLSLAAQIAHIHHGNITAKSIEGQGSTFIVRLPLRQYAPMRSASSRIFARIKQVLREKAS